MNAHSLILIVGYLYIFQTLNPTNLIKYNTYSGSYVVGICFALIFISFTGNNNSWAKDSANAVASLYDGMSGHLATVTSQGENDFLFSLVSGSFSGFKSAGLGGKAPEGWLEGPEVGQNFIYTNWGGGEPNNSGYAYINKRY